HRLLVTAHPFEGDHLALDRQDRLDVQQRAGPGARASDPPATPEEFERVDREDQVRVTLVALEQLADLLVRGATFEPALDRESEHRDRGRGSAGVDGADLAAAELLRRGRRARVRAREVA